ncbi:MAG TPA: trypsin-like peptidase domain-containing protein [Vicinamibacterales bacterium]|nr:trypsin-like peptidase domain-containing protein [Vicinamibacterales bacterium]
MSDLSISTFSDQLADAVASVAASVVQVQGRHRPVSGVVYAPGVVLATARALGREDGVRVTTPDGRTLDAEFGGWDPASGLVVVRASGLDAPPVPVATAPARVGHLALAVARSWSNAITASAGLVSVIGGPLPTWRGGKIDQVIRTSAPMHDGFAGGAFIDVRGQLIGVSTAASIRGLNVVIPAAIAWKTAAQLVEYGTPRRGYLGLAGQPVHLADRKGKDRIERNGLLIVSVSGGSPADAAGLLVGDVLLEFDGEPVESPGGLLELLDGSRVGRAVSVRILRGGVEQAVTVTVGERTSQTQ